MLKVVDTKKIKEGVGCNMQYKKNATCLEFYTQKTQKRGRVQHATNEKKGYVLGALDTKTWKGEGGVACSQKKSATHLELWTQKTYDPPPMHNTCISRKI